MIKRLSFLIILLTIFSPVVAKAEGSKELTQDGGDRPFLDDRTDFFNGLPRRSTIKVYVRAGEVLQLGSSAIGVGNGNIIATAPNGQQFSCLILGNGLIANRAQEVAGPGNPGGFTPCSPPPVTAAQEGIWEIQFLAPTRGDQNPTTIAANGNWPAQGPVNSFVTAWDVTVRKNQVVQPGRAFANSLALNTNLANVNSLPQVNSRLFVQTQDGYLYNVNLNGLEPVGFIFFSNQNGFIDASGKPTYKSVEAPNQAINLTNPPSDDNFTHKLFFNQPDTILPTTANSPSGNTWLKPATVTPPQPSDLRFFGKEGTENQTGTNPLQGNFTFVAPEARPFTISIDINNNGSFTDSIDRVIIGTATVGLNTVPWDGKDGQGNDVPPSALGYRAQVKLYGGEVHFPLLDPERNPNGLIINRITPVTGVAGDPTYNPDWMYYDDSNFTNRPGIAPNPIKLLTGGPSSGGIRRFFGNSPGNPQTNANGWWGDKRGIDTWAFVPSQPVELNGRIQVLQADLNIIKTLTSPNTTPGNPITYAITVTNNGPSNVTGVGVKDIFPPEIASATWTCAITGTGLCPTPSGSGNIETTVNLNNGAVATFLVSGTLASGATGAINNSATVTRPKDVADPVDQDRSGGTNETETATTTFSGLGIAKQAGAVVNNGNGTFSIPYTLVITNTTIFAFSNLQVTEDLKATFGNSPFTIDSLTSPDGLTVNSSFNGDSDKNLLAGTDTLPANATRTIQFTVRVTPTSSAPPYQNTARVSGTTPGGIVVTDDSTNGANPDPDGNGNPSDNSVPTEVNFNVPRLGVAKEVGTPTIANGTEGLYWIPYTITVKNLGSVAITNLQVTDNLSTNLNPSPTFEIRSISSPTLTVNSGFNSNPNQNLSFGSNQNLLEGTDTLAVGKTAQITFYVELELTESTGSFTNQATGTGNAGSVSDVSTKGTNPDTNGDGNPNEQVPTVVSITQNPVLGVAKSAGLPINNNDGSYTIRYTLNVANLGDVAINTLQVTDNLSSTFNNSFGTVPFSVDTSSISSPTLTVNANFNGNANQNLLDGTDPLAVGQTAQISFNVRITPGTNNGPFSNSAAANGTSSAGPVSDVSTNGSNPDPNGDGNPSENQPTVIDIPRLGVAKAAANPINNNDGTYTIPYTLVVKNMGNVAINNLQVTDNLSSTFGSVPFSIEAGSISSPSLTVNSGFNGNADQNLLVANSTNNNLAVGATAEIKFKVRITPGKNNGPFNNTATANGTTSAGLVNDVSTDGADPDRDNDGNSANDGDGNPNNNNQATVVNIPRLGIAKAAGTPVNNNNGTYTIPYTLVVKNMGNVAINSLQVTDDLIGRFGSALTSVEFISISSGFNRNQNFNGNTDKTLLTGADTLVVGATAEIKFNVVITPGSNLGPFNNTARANGTSPGGATVEDDSTDGAEPDPNGDGDPGNNSSPTSVRISGNSNLRLIKRVTRVNETPLTGVVDDLNDPNDNAPSWPANYLQGQADVPNVSPGDEVEYTIYFLSDGGVPANNVRICDRIPQDQTFVTDGFAVGGGSAVQFGTNTLTPLTNANDSDSGTFFPTPTTIDINLCSASNTNGALIWNLGNVPSNTNPINYGFVRFRAKVK